MSDADEKIAAGTHVLMPVKATGEMCEAIEGYYSNTVLFKNRRRDTEMKAACWGALMAYGAMVKLFKNAAPQGNKAGSTPSDSGAGSGNQSLSLKRVLLPNNPAGAAPKDWVTNATASKNAHR